jgi:tetratricopeptide (TPR) repeat protein
MNNPDLDDLEDEISILAKGVDNGVDNEDTYDSDNDEDEDNNNDIFSKIDENVVDQIFGPSVNTLWSKKTRLRSGKTAGKRLPTQISNILADAQSFFLSRQYEEAIQLLSEVTRLAPKLPDPYHTMGMIYVESGDILRGIQFYAIAATYTPNCHELWRKIASLAFDIGEYRQAIQALNTAIKINSADPNLYRFRILISIKHNKNHHAKDLIKAFLVKFPSQIDIHLECVDLFLSYGLKNRALQSLLRYILQIIGTSDIPNFNSIVSLYKLSLYPEFLKPIQIIYIDNSQELDVLMYSVRKLCDVMMEDFDSCISSNGDMKACRNIILSITKAIIIYIEKLQNEYNKTSEKLINFENLKISMDVGLIYGNCLLQSKSDDDIDKGMLVIIPLLEIINKLEIESVTKLNETSSNITDHVIPVSAFDNETDLFLTRQMLRIASSFGETGKTTRGEKILSSGKCYLFFVIIIYYIFFLILILIISFFH